MWKKDIDAKCGQIPSLLLGNKVRISPTKYRTQNTEHKIQNPKIEHKIQKMINTGNLSRHRK